MTLGKAFIWGQISNRLSHWCVMNTLQYFIWLSSNCRKFRGINQEYLHTIKGSTLEALRNKMNNTEIEGKIIGADNRVQVMAECAIQYGREQNVLESDVLSHLMQEDIERRDDYSRKGVEKYQNSDIEGKFATLIEMGALNADAVMDRDGDCDINKLYDAMESSKGVIVMQVATTAVLK